MVNHLRVTVEDRIIVVVVLVVVLFILLLWNDGIARHGRWLVPVGVGGDAGNDGTL